MTTLVTFGPTQEPLDAMRILSNRSTGALGTELALTMAQAGHQVIALRGTGATADTGNLVKADIRILPFTTTEDLRRTLEQLSETTIVDAIFHLAAVSDFYFPGAGNGKIPTSAGPFTLTLEPTPKILPLLRGWFPTAQITGWKFEASEIARSEDQALATTRAQITRADTDACVLNGSSYGKGFGFLGKEAGSFRHLATSTELCEFLRDQLGKR